MIFQFSASAWEEIPLAFPLFNLIIKWDAPPMENYWTIEDAENDFAAIAKAAYAGEPQYITNGSLPDLVIMPKSSFDEMDQKQCEENKKFVDFLMSIPKGELFIDENNERHIQLRDIEF